MPFFNKTPAPIRNATFSAPGRSLREFLLFANMRKKLAAQHTLLLSNTPSTTSPPILTLVFILSVQLRERACDSKYY